MKKGLIKEEINIPKKMDEDKGGMNIIKGGGNFNPNTLKASIRIISSNGTLIRVVMELIVMELVSQRLKQNLSATWELSQKPIAK